MLGDAPAARRAARAAWEANPFLVPVLLEDIHAEGMPEDPPPGNRDEAVAYWLDALDAWGATPGALDWLMETWIAPEGGAPLRPPSGPGSEGAARPKVGRNDPCPCGSGKKYKHCCLRKEER